MAGHLPGPGQLHCRLHVARDQLALAADVIADTVISLVRAIYRLDLANLKGTVDRATYKATIRVEVLTVLGP